MMQKISIVTVVFNRCEDLKKTIHSCINQTYRNKEYIIIDGGSTDGSVDVIKSYQNDIDYWISEHDKGIFDAMNKSLKFVTGDYVIFMNAGDVFVSSHIIEDVFGKKEYSENIVYGDSILHNKYGYLYRKNGSIYARKANVEEYVFKGQQICHQAMFTKSDILKKVRFNLKYKLGADYDTTAKIMKFSPKSFCDVKMPICIFDDMNGGASHRQLMKILNERAQMFEYKKGLSFYFFLIKNSVLNIVRKSVSYTFPFIKYRYVEKKYKKNIQETWSLSQL